MKIRKIRLFLIIIWLLIAGLIVWFKVLPLGHVTYSKNYLKEFNLTGGKGFIGLLTPVERMVKNSKSQVIGDPVYFSIFTPRTFNEVKLTITYKPTLSSKTPIIETGVLVDKTVWRYKMAPLQNDIIDNLKDWFLLRDGNLLVLQRQNTFKDVNSAVASLQKSNQAAWYNVPELSTNPSLGNSLMVNPFSKITIPLRGTHQFYFLGNSKLSKQVSLELSDLNIDKDVDNVEISVYDGVTKIYSTQLSDTYGNELSSKPRDFNFKFDVPLTSLSNKLYKLEIKASDDIITRQILSAPSALSAVSRLNLAMAPDQPLSFWTNSPYLQVTATDPAGCQTINFDGQDFKIAEAYQQFEISSNRLGLKEIKVSKSGLIIENNNTLSFTPNSLLDLNSKQIDRHFLLSNQTQFIITNYTAPEILEDGWRRATVTLNTKDAYREKGKYSFIISVPGLSLAKDGNIEIASIKAEFFGRNLFDKLKEIVQSYVN
ncbi:MAG: hypothetical protein WAW11_05540 [Patescibacteria group bacterium]